MDSCKLATHEITRTSAELIIAVGVDLDQGLNGDEGKYRLKIQQSEGDSRMLLRLSPCMLVA